MINFKKIFVIRCNSFFLFHTDLVLLYFNIADTIRLFYEFNNIQNFTVRSSTGKYKKTFLIQQKCQTVLAINFEIIKEAYGNTYLDYVIKDIQKIGTH